jgi:hypothetical protein
MAMLANLSGMTPTASDEAVRRNTASRMRASLKASGLIVRAQHGVSAVRGAIVSEPTSTAAGGFVLWKAAGGLAVFAAVGAFLAAVVAMCMMTPRSAREWAVGIISTVVCSLAGGAWAILKLGLLQSLPDNPAALYLSLVAGLGIVFACGLPGWAIVRGIFTWLEKHRDSDIGQMARDAHSDAGKVEEP